MRRPSVMQPVNHYSGSTPSSNAINQTTPEISGWANHSSFNDATGSKQPFRRYLALRNVISSHHDNDGTLRTLSSPSMFVFESPDDYHRHFMTGNTTGSDVN